MFYIKNTVGTVNFSPYLHVTASKVSAPGTIVWEHWFPTPVSNEAFPIPVADAENYYIRYYEAADDSSLGTLHLELIVNALTNETLFERRWYLVGGPGDTDPADGSTQLIDPYLISKNIYGIFKEGFRYLKEDDEYNFNELTGEINVVTGVQYAAGERIMIEIKYTVGSTATSSSGGLYSGSIEVAEAEKTLTVENLGLRIICAGTEDTQKFLLPSLLVVPNETGFYFDNSVKGVAVQPVLHCNGADKIKYNGFMAPSDEFTDLWVSKGEHILLRARDGFWEVVTDYKGASVGEKVTLGFKGHPNILTENGQLIDGEIYGRLWWWVNNILPNTHKYTDDTVENLDWIPDPQRLGQFAVHSTNKSMRMPKTGNLSERGLKDFETYGTDVANRPVDYPGGFQDEMVFDHYHLLTRNTEVSPPSGTGTKMASRKVFGNNSDYLIEKTVLDPDYLQSGTAKNDVQTKIGAEQRLKGNGVIFARRI